MKINITWSAIAEIIVASIVAYPITYLFPAANAPLVNTTAITIVGVIGEAMGIRGRVFILPVWLVGLLGLGWSVYELWGWVAAIGPVLAAVGGFVFMVMWAKKLEKTEWAVAPAALSRTYGKAAAGQMEDFWQEMGQALFVAGFMENSPQVCRHNLDVLDLLGKHAAKDAQPAIERLARRYRMVMDKDPPQEISDKLTDPVREIIENRGVPAAPEIQEASDAAE